MNQEELIGQMQKDVMDLTSKYQELGVANQIGAILSVAAILSEDAGIPEDRLVATLTEFYHHARANNPAHNHTTIILL